MQNAAVIRMRKEYAALVAVADGLVDMIHARQACNVLTFARMAEEARAAARKVAAAIERLILGEPKKEKRGVLAVLGKVARALCALLT